MFNKLKKHIKNVAQESKEAFYEGLSEEPTPKEVTEALSLFGLSKETTLPEIKIQFKALSKLYHPDTKTNSDSEQFIRIKEAYDVLKLHYKS